MNSSNDKDSPERQIIEAEIVNSKECYVEQITQEVEIERYKTKREELKTERTKARAGAFAGVMIICSAFASCAYCWVN